MSDLNRFYRFENVDALLHLLVAEEPFVLSVGIGNGDEKFLNQISNICMENACFTGIIFEVEDIVDKTDKLFFLQSVFSRLITAGKIVDFKGIPVCALRTFVNGYTYMRLMQEKMSYEGRDIAGHPHLYQCDNCDFFPRCSENGVDENSLKKRMQLFETAKEHNPFEKNSPLYNRHNAFLNHCASFDNAVIRRAVYYVMNSDFGSRHSYDDRFFYACLHLPADGFQKEFEFLASQCSSTAYVDLLKSIACGEKSSQIGYGIAKKENVTRETFYMNADEQYGKRLLDDFNISYRVPDTPDLHFTGIGIDVIAGRTEGYKLYFRSPRSFIANYLDFFEIDVKNIMKKTQHLVIRLDSSQNFLSYKIEIHLKKHELYLFKKYLKNYEYLDANFDKLRIYVITLEIDADRISKVNIYHERCIPESEDNEK